MRKLLAAALVAVLAFALVVPSVAFARKGGVPASARGRGHAAASATAEEQPQADKPGKGRQDKGSKPDRGARQGAVMAASEDASETPDGEEQGGQLRERERTGIANALERLQRNLARMQAQMEAGQRKGLPSGLQRVIAKFLGWLGLDGGTVEEPSDGTDDGTVSDEPTETVEPTQTIGPEPADLVPAE
ncbi:MAG: hypothetical protein QMD96_05875 [Anaerosomatales bacterium]|nr:hypothetical protein [Anaerosomatales bacterium]